MNNVTFCTLLYGDRPELAAMHSRCLESIRRCAPESRILAWCNLVGDDTRATCKAVGAEILGDDGQNTPKYPAMRKMLATIRTEWVGWLDDDTWMRPECDLQASWAKLPAGTVYCGQEMSIAYTPEFSEWIRTRSWFTGRRPWVQPNIGKPVLRYAAGCWWFLRMDLARKLDWPDPALIWRGGDRLLGEAVWQAGHSLANFRPAGLVPGGSVSRHNPISDPHSPPPWEPVPMTREEMRRYVAGMTESDFRQAVADVLFERQ